ncbi:MAG: LamG-like jellyroll fold domain-containing protein, partial [Vicinamibacterales bacterium]
MLPSRRSAATLLVCLSIVCAPAGQRSASAQDVDLVAAFNFDQAGEIVPDLTGRGHDARCPPWACPTFLPHGGRLGSGAYSFSGLADYFELDREQDFDFTHSFSVSLWVQIERFTSPWETFVSKGDSSWGVSRFYESPRPAFTTFAPSPHDLHGGPDIADGGWHHISAVFDQGVKRLYVDGILVTQATADAPVAANDLRVRVGHNEEYPVADLGGVIDDLRIYRRALSSEEIVRDRDRSLSRIDEPSTNPTRGGDEPPAVQPPPVVAPPGVEPPVVANPPPVVEPPPVIDPPVVTPPAVVPPPVTQPSPTPPIGSSGGALRVLSSNPRYFTDGSGRAVLLTGSHTWSTLMDNGAGDPPPVFDYTAYLDFLAGLGHNFFRLWTWEQARWSLSTSDDQYFFGPVLPFRRTGPGTALDGKPRFDLDQLDDAYYVRLRARVEAAAQRGLYVAV